MTATPTLSLWAHRALANDPKLNRPKLMADVLNTAGLTAQWWNLTKRGMITKPAPDRVEALCYELGVSTRSFYKSLRETQNRVQAGQIC